MPKGGLRLGAGRKPKEITELKRKLQKNFAAAILTDGEESRLWREHLMSKDPRVSIDALKAMSEHKHGKAKQTLDLDANVNLVARVDVNV
jgi:hypothetical protein